MIGGEAYAYQALNRPENKGSIGDRRRRQAGRPELRTCQDLKLPSGLGVNSAR